MKEIWKPVKDFEKVYMISNFGNIKRLEKIIIRKNPKNKNTLIKYTYKEKLLSLKNDKDGYKFIILCDNGRRKVSRIHRLVAEAFLDNPNNYPIINHKDENKSNNHIDNLEWCTIKYNTNYKNSILKRSISQGKPVIYNNNFYYSIGIAAKLNNTYPSKIYNECRYNKNNNRYATKEEIENWKSAQCAT